MKPGVYNRLLDKCDDDERELLEELLAARKQVVHCDQCDGTDTRENCDVFPDEGVAFCRECKHS